jgi:hypothetical protein
MGKLKKNLMTKSVGYHLQNYLTSVHKPRFCRKLGENQSYLISWHYVGIQKEKFGKNTNTSNNILVQAKGLEPTKAIPICYIHSSSGLTEMTDVLLGMLACGEISDQGEDTCSCYESSRANGIRYFVSVTSKEVRKAQLIRSNYEI